MHKKLSSINFGSNKVLIKMVDFLVSYRIKNIQQSKPIFII